MKNVMGTFGNFYVGEKILTKATPVKKEEEGKEVMAEDHKENDFLEEVVGSMGKRRERIERMGKGGGGEREGEVRKKGKKKKGKEWDEGGGKRARGNWRSSGSRRGGLP